MKHLEDGAMQAFLDDEMPAVERAGVAQHLLGCETCHERYQELTQANALFTQSVSLLDVEPPAATPPTPTPAATTAMRRARAGTYSFVKAAGLVLALAAAASAAVPGSPVRQWVANAIEPDRAPAPQVVAEQAPAPVATLPPAPAGLSISPAGGTLVVSLDRMDGSAIRLAGAEGSQASVSVVGAERDPEFRTGPGRLLVRDGVGGTVHVRLPVNHDGARLEVEGRLYAESRGGEIRVLVPPQTVDEEFGW